MNKNLKIILIVAAVIAILGLGGYFLFQQAKKAATAKINELVNQNGFSDLIKQGGLENIQSLMMQFATGGAKVCEETPEDKRACYIMFALREKNDSYCPKADPNIKFVEACQKSVQATKEGKSLVEAYGFISAYEEKNNPEPPTGQTPEPKPEEQKDVTQAKTYEEGLAMCNAEPLPLCYFFLGATFNRPDACNNLMFDSEAKKECDTDAAQGFADTKEMIRLLKN